MMIHKLKITEPYFSDILKGVKNFEIRKNDRDFQVGDIIVLRLFKNNEITGDDIDVVIKYILKDCPQFGLLDNYCIIGFDFIRYQVRNIYLDEFELNRQ